MKPVAIDVTSDFICPWCWIGHQHLQRAIRGAGGIEVASVRYHPFELNPSMPAGGMDRKEYRSAKFGSWARSQAMDADVTVTGRRAGIEFNYDKVGLTPNTRLAHRLMHFAQEAGSQEQISTLYDAIFSAYFSHGRDIGALDVLVELAAASGFESHTVRAHLESQGGVADVIASELQSQRDGVRSVPTLRIGGEQIAGAQQASVLARAMVLAAKE